MSRNDDRTFVSPHRFDPHRLSPIRVLFSGPGGVPVHKTFNSRFVVGRSPECDVCIPDEGISRRHCEVYPQDGDWWIRDLDSSNGTFVDGRQVSSAKLAKDTRLAFFSGGPLVRLQVDDARIAGLGPSTPTPPTDAATSGPDPLHPVAQGAASHAEQRHRKRFLIGMSVMSLLLLAALAVIFLQHQERQSGQSVAEQLFFETKALELELARLKQELARRPERPLPAAVREANERLAKMRERYATLADERALLGGHRSKTDLLIFRVARLFGEYDLDIPDSFVAEVKRYIREWQATGRLANAVARIRENGSGEYVAAALRRRGLPSQFVYLAVQESNFRTDAIGPRTRHGIAKGMWQFIPGTAERYGLRVGPAADERRYDPRDERFDFEKSTNAAADYLSYLFTTEARASGLLVMSAYNWGEGRVARTLGRLTEGPGEYNFWRLIQSQRIPDETYGYVLRIYAAAVIGEDPRHFGFDFDNPLAGL